MNFDEQYKSKNPNRLKCQSAKKLKQYKLVKNKINGKVCSEQCCRAYGNYLVYCESIASCLRYILFSVILFCVEQRDENQM